MMRINLLGAEPSDHAGGAMPKPAGATAALVLAVAATLAGIAAVWWWQNRADAALRQRHALAMTEQRQLAETVARVQALETRRAALAPKLGLLETLQQSQGGAARLLDRIGGELSDGLWLTEMIVADGEVAIVGEALSEIAIADFAENLRLSADFAGTSLDSSQDTGDSVRFQLSTRFVPLSAPSPVAAFEASAAPANRR